MRNVTTCAITHITMTGLQGNIAFACFGRIPLTKNLRKHLFPPLSWATNNEPMVDLSCDIRRNKRNTNVYFIVPSQKFTEEFETRRGSTIETHTESQLFLKKLEKTLQQDCLNFKLGINTNAGLRYGGQTQRKT